MPKWLPIPLPRLIHRSADESELPQDIGARMINVHLSELGTIRSRPKTFLFSDLGTNADVDGLYWSKNRLYVIAVSAGNSYKLDINGNVTNITGNTLRKNKPVSFATDGTLIAMANGGKIVTQADGGTTTYLADVNAPTAVDHLAFIDTYLLANIKNTTGWKSSAVGDITDFTNGVSYNAEYDPDELIALFVANREIYLFGPDTTERWYNDGVSPFSPIGTGLIDEGAIKNTIQEFSGSFIFMNAERRVIILTGNAAQNISTSFDDVFRDLIDVSDARSMMMHIGNRAFYVITFEIAGRTFVYDLSTKGWAEWGIYDVGTGSYGMFNARSHCYCETWNFHLIGGNNDGKIYKLGYDYTDDAGAMVREVIRTGQIDHGTENEKRCNGILIRMKRGLGGGLGSDTKDPMIHIRWRDDGGPWGNEVPMSLGKIGDNEYYARLNKLGRYRTRQWEIISTFDVNIAISRVSEFFKVLKT